MNKFRVALKDNLEKAIRKEQKSLDEWAAGINKNWATPTSARYDKVIIAAPPAPIPPSCFYCGRRITGEVCKGCGAAT